MLHRRASNACSSRSKTNAVVFRVRVSMTCSAPSGHRGADRSGLGLGLAFSRRAVEASNGRIYAHNLPPKGCVFTIDLPRIATPAIATV
jgi:hypothetical protein